MLLLMALCGVMLGVASCDRAVEPGTRKVAFIAGEATHGEGSHTWEEVAQLLKQCLLDAPDVEPLHIDIHKDGWPEDPAALDDADAIVFLSDGYKDHPLNESARAAKIRKLAKRGVGLA
ncbi:MAG: hypothetical protein ACYS74_17205, partial [Planctomycetota bacterium]